MKSLRWSALAEAFKSRDCETGPDLLLNLSLITCLTHRSFKIKHTVRVCSALFPSALSTNAESTTHDLVRQSMRGSME